METIAIVKSKILTYLDRNLVLEPTLVAEIKTNLPTLSIDQIHSIYEILAHLDEVQTNSLVSRLDAEPYFFKKIEYLIYKAMYEEHIALEKNDHDNADMELKNALEAL